MVMALKPIHDKFNIKRVVVSTYQSVSGSGQKAIDEIMDAYSGRHSPGQLCPHSLATTPRTLAAPCLRAPLTPTPRTMAAILPARPWTPRTPAAPCLRALLTRALHTPAAPWRPALPTPAPRTLAAIRHPLSIPHVVPCLIHTIGMNRRCACWSVLLLSNGSAVAAAGHRRELA